MIFGMTTFTFIHVVLSLIGIVAGFVAMAGLLASKWRDGWTAIFLAATVATWFTFLPSFVFILAGGPLVEATHGQLKFTAPLTAITAAVVGVIASLALFFIAHIAQGTGGPGIFGTRIDWAALFLAALAAVALLRFKLGVITVILACALAGLALRLAGWG